MGRAAVGQLGACFLLVTVSGCLSHQSRNSIRRAWVDFNSLGQPTVTFEQTDHLPYHAERVGDFLWMYGKTPGHQNLYKDRRYQKELQASAIISAGETQDIISGGVPSGRVTESVASPGSQPPAPPDDLPAPAAKPAPAPAGQPLPPPAPAADPSPPVRPNRHPPVPALPKPAFPTPPQGPTARQTVPNGWTAYRDKK